MHQRGAAPARGGYEMAKNKGGLGRGLDSLFADTLPENESESWGEVTILPLRDI